MSTIVGNYAGCLACGERWYRADGRVCYMPAGWIGPCCKPLNDDGTARDLEKELAPHFDENNPEGE